MLNDLFWALYWIDALSNLGVFFSGPGFVMGCVFFAVISSLAPWLFGIAAKVKYGIWWFIGSTLLGIVTCLIPSKQTMYLMLGVKGGEAVVNSEFGKKIGSIIEGQLDDYVEQFGKKKKKE